jgi:dTDP-4-amino-4,6-dideoxygalactose transaminase
VFDENELVNLVDSSLEFWLASGRYTDRFEKQFAEYLQVPFCSLVNSGSSANLLAFMALTFVRPAERFGALAIATNGSVVSFNEKLGGDYAEDRIVPYCVRAA